jgi:squalene-associated FAD-dependent desaturase
MTGCVHIVGAGLAGLAAALALTAAGRAVRLYEAAPQAGGRCRSYFDSELGCRIDNGNHLLLTGNRRALAYLRQSGGLGALDAAAEAAFAFFDARTGERWTVRPNRGRLPWWVANRRRRAPGTKAGDYLAALALLRADPSATVAGVLGGGELYARLWEPLAVAALNTAAEEASARLFWTILRETLGRGGAACRPLLPKDGLSETFVDPALARLRAAGVTIRFGARLRALDFAGDRVERLVFDGEPVMLSAGDGVVLAVPAPAAARLVPSLIVPDRFAPIVNAHYRIAAPPGSPNFIGVIGGLAQWVFRKREVLSVTVSAADALVDRPAEELRAALWRDAARAYDFPIAATPPARIVKERRATFRASPEQLARRPRPVTAWPNLLLAGDYTDTGLPATIEGAIASGFAVAQAILARRPGRDRRARPAAISAIGREQRRALG